MKRTRSPRGVVDTHPIEDRTDDPRADRHVATFAVLPDVVQEGAQQEGIGIGDLLHGLGLDGIVRRAVPREDSAPSRGGSSSGARPP